jgi:FkbM family methyltransferase
MLLQQAIRFVRKPAAERQVTVRYLTRRALARLPFAPIRSRLRVASGEELRFWWSRIPMDFHPDRALLEYWGDDRGALRFLWEFLEPGMVFFDVGAFHGIFSVLAGKKLSSRGQVVAFEPSLRERRRFELHVRINGLSRIRLEPYAVSSRTEKLTFFTVAPAFGMMNSLKPPAVQVPVRETVVEAVSLDEYLLVRPTERIDLMKIDVEGGELAAFRGARKLLESIRPILICEVLDWVTQPWGYAAREIVNHLRHYDYDWFDFSDDGSLSPHAQKEEYPEPKNYVAVPREKLPLIARWCPGMNQSREEYEGLPCEQAAAKGTR